MLVCISRGRTQERPAIRFWSTICWQATIFRMQYSLNACILLGAPHSSMRCYKSYQCSLCISWGFLGMAACVSCSFTQVSPATEVWSNPICRLMSPQLASGRLLVAIFHRKHACSRPQRKLPCADNIKPWRSAHCSGPNSY
jgi:hypothetical protein